MIDPKRLPTGARADRDFAREIASSSEELYAAYVYWRGQFIDFTGQPSFLAENEYRKFADTLVRKSLRAVFPKRAYLTDPSDESRMVTWATCLLSSRDIARHLGIKSIWDALKAFEDTAQSQETENSEISPPAQDVINGILSIREFFDLIRRILYCKLNSERLEVSLDELLALFRQEGALVLTPPQSSFRHSPLVETKPGLRCRTESVIITVKGVGRPGFNLTFPMSADYSDKHKALQAMMFNFLVVGGLDTVVAPRSSDKDELHKIAKEIIFYSDNSKFTTSEPVVRLNEKYLRKLEATGKMKLWNILEGLAKVELEGKEEVPSLNELLGAVVDRLDGLINSHQVEARDGSGFLLGMDKGEETFNVLEIQSDWYKSRKALRTLLAYKDRAGMNGLEQSFSSFVTYLRYNLGDLLFLYTLSRILPRLGQLYKSWPKSKRNKLNALLSPNSINYREALEKSGWFQNKELRSNLIAEAEEAKKFWRAARRVKDRDKREKLNWHFVGLSRSLIAKSPEEPWKRVFGKPEQDEQLMKMAQKAVSIIRPLAELNLVMPICLAFESLPVSKLRTYGISGTALINAHSFERMRLAYKDAWENATKDV